MKQLPEVQPSDSSDQQQSIGDNVSRVDGVEKVTGTARYGPDLTRSDLLYAATLRSDEPHGTLVDVNSDAAANLDGVVCVLSRSQLMGQFDDRIRYCGDIIAAVAATDLQTAREAVALIEYSIEPTESVHDPTDAVKKSAPVVHRDGTPLREYSRRHEFTVENEAYRTNVDDYHQLEIGDVDEGFADADLVHTGTYTTPRVCHCNLATHCVTAAWTGETLTLTETIASVGHGRKLLSEFLEMEATNIRIETPPTASSSFGGRSLPKLSLEPVAASLARETGRPIKLQFDRREEFVATSTRHHTQYSITTGVTDDGELTAMEIDAVTDTGAYPNGVGHIVLTNSQNRPLDLYTIPNYRYEGVSVLTNNPPAGEYRGIGSTQLMFALESHMDELSRKLDCNPSVFRLENAVSEGDKRPHTGVPIESCGLVECMERSETIFDDLCVATSDRPNRVIGHGIAAGTHTTAAGARTQDSTEVRIVLTRDGTVTLESTALDLGQGAETVLSQIIADVVGVALTDITVETVASDAGLEDELGSVASRTTYLIGAAVRDASRSLTEQLCSLAASVFDVSPEVIEIEDGCVEVSETETHSVGALLSLAGESKLVVEGVASSGLNPPSYGVHRAEVAVDTETGHIDLLTYIAAQDVGFAINPKLVEGQIEGAIQHGTEFALYAELQLDDGMPINPTLTEYPVISPLDMPDTIACELIESNEETGPYGAKGVGTPVMTPIAPAILNAVRDATGVRFGDPPVTSEVVYNELHGGEQ